MVQNENILISNTKVRAWDFYPGYIKPSTEPKASDPIHDISNSLSNKEDLKRYCLINKICV